MLQKEIKELMQAVKFQGQEVKHLRAFMQQRFSAPQWIIGIGFGLISTLQVVLIAFLLNAKL